MSKIHLGRLRAWAVEHLPKELVILRDVIRATPREVDALTFIGLAYALQLLLNIELEKIEDGSSLWGPAQDFKQSKMVAEAPAANGINRRPKLGS